MPPRFASVDEYLSSREPDQADTLRRVIDTILAEFPELAVKIAWNVPQIHRGPDYVFGVSAAKRHLSLAPWSGDVIAQFRARLEADGHVVKQQLFQVADDWELDQPLLIDLVRARLAELDAGAS